jgi:hypothetical protein
LHGPNAHAEGRVFAAKALDFRNRAARRLSAEYFAEFFGAFRNRRSN